MTDEPTRGGHEEQMSSEKGKVILIRRTRRLGVVQRFYMATKRRQENDNLTGHKKAIRYCRNCRWLFQVFLKLLSAHSFLILCQ